MKLQPEPWTLRDLLALQYFQIWSSSVNWQQELLTLELIDTVGSERAAELAPLNINPNRQHNPGSSPQVHLLQELQLQNQLAFSFDNSLFTEQRREHARGSNAWVSGSRKSVNGTPIVVNDPHIDTRRLPGFWYPMGLITPDLRAVGVSAPGTPGLGVGRTNYIAWGATNGYSDMVDLYIEQLDPADSSRYLEGAESYPFAVREEVIKIKDEAAAGGFRKEKITVRST